jgi:hypothetical protein
MCVCDMLRFKSFSSYVYVLVSYDVLCRYDFFFLVLIFSLVMIFINASYIFHDLAPKICYFFFIVALCVDSVIIFIIRFLF